MEKEHVSEGIENNFIQITDLVETQEVAGASRIPEAGGLLSSKPSRVAGPPSTSNRKKGKKNNKKRKSKLKKKSNKNNKIANESQDGDEEEKEDEDGFTGTTTEDVTGTSREETPMAEPLDGASENPGDFHILPIDQNVNTTQSDNFIGGPGPVIVSNPNEIKEFSEVRNVDAKELNERLNKKEPVVESAVEPVIEEPAVKSISELPPAEEPTVETKEIAPKVDEPASELETITPVVNEPEALPVPETQESITEPPKVEPVGKTVQPELVEKHEPTGAALDTSKEAESKVKQEETHTLDPTVKKDSKPASAEKAEVKAKKSPAATEEKDKKKKRHEEKISKEVKRSESTKEKKHSTKEPKKQPSTKEPKRQPSTKVPKKQTASPLSSTSEDQKKKKTGFFGKLKKLFKSSN